MNDRPEDRDRDAHLGRLAGELGLALPPFDGPLVVFDPAAEERGPGDPIYLGGDLHAIHPSVDEAPAPDPTLDRAGISLIPGDSDTGPIETSATRGVWCLALHDELTELSLFLTVRDGEGRLRVWLQLPPAGEVLGQGHLWLPRVAHLR